MLASDHPTTVRHGTVLGAPTSDRVRNLSPRAGTHPFIVPLHWLLKRAKVNRLLRGIARNPRDNQVTIPDTKHLFFGPPDSNIVP